MKKNQQLINTILKYTLIFTLLIYILLSIFIRHNKSFVWINVSNDGLDQHLINLYYFKQLFNNFLNTGHVNTFTWNIGYGLDMFANLAYYIFGDFLSYTALFTKTEDLNILYNILIIMRLYLVGISFIIFGYYKKLNSLNNLIGALIYTFSTFTLFAMARHPYFINPLIIFPILLLATERIILENKPIFFTTMVALTFISSFYFGYMLSLTIMIYGIILTIHNYKKETPKFIIKKLLTIFLYALLGVLLSSFILIPTAYAFLTSTRTDSSIYVYPRNYYKYLIESFISIKNTGAWSLLGVSSLLLTIFPTFLKNYKKHFPIALLLIILFIPILIPMIGSLFAGLSYPNNRWSFIITFIFAYIISLSLDKEYPINIKHTIIFIISYTLILIIINKTLNSQLIIAIILSLIFTVIINYKYKISKLYPYLIITTLTINLGYNLYYTYDSKFNNYISEFIERDTMPLYNNANHDIPYLSDATSYLKSIDKSYYNTIIYPNKLYNLSIINNYNSISYFYSIVNHNYLELATDLENSEISINKEIKNFNHRTQITSLLNTKYLITTDINYVPYGYELIKNYDNTTYIYKNNYSLSFANLYTNTISFNDYQQLSPLDKESLMLEATVIDNPTNNYNYQSTIEKINYTIDNNPITNNTLKVPHKNYQITLNLPPINNSEVYLYIKNLKYKPNKLIAPNAYTITATIGNKIQEENTKDKHSSAYYFKNDHLLINLGYFQELQENLDITFSSIGTYTFDSLEILTINFKDYQQKITNLNNSNFNLIDYNYNELTATVNPTSDGILQFSTNYSKGWQVYIDDIPTKTFKSNNYFLGINITKGSHKITLKYHTPYQTTGQVISIISLLIYIIIIIKHKNLKKTYKL